MAVATTASAKTWPQSPKPRLVVPSQARSAIFSIRPPARSFTLNGMQLGAFRTSSSASPETSPSSLATAGQLGGSFRSSGLLVSFSSLSRAAQDFSRS